MNEKTPTLKIDVTYKFSGPLGGLCRWLFNRKLMTVDLSFHTMPFDWVEGKPRTGMRVPPKPL